MRKFLYSFIIKTSAIFIWILILIGFFVTLKNIQPEKNEKPLVLNKLNELQQGHLLILGSKLIMLNNHKNL